MRAFVIACILCLSATLSAGDLSLRDAIVYVKANSDGNGYGMLSAVCVSEDGVFLSAGHGGFTKGNTYELSRGHDTTYFTTATCVGYWRLKDDHGEGVVVLKDNAKNPRHTFVKLGETPKPSDWVHGMGYAGGRMAYTEGKVTGLRNGGRFITADFRMLNGASGGGLFDEKHRLLGILSSRSLLPGETKDGRSDPPSTTWIGVEVFRPCVEPFLSK